LPDTGNPVLNNIYYGAVPPDAQSRPVLLFVHGLGGLAEDWWMGFEQFGLNDMYVIAYNRGYRTAFVTLNVSGERGPGQSVDVNGQTLGEQIAAVAQHYGVQQVDIVAHSKGGVDAQAAIVHYGAAPRVRNVFTLSTPHQGAELADLVFSQEDNAQLVEMLQNIGLPFDFDDGLRAMTTDSMKAFRERTDALAQQQPVRYYTAGGIDWGARNSPLRISGKLLATKGPNDGLVTVNSTKLPYGTTLFTQPYHHFNIYHGTGTRSVLSMLPTLCTPRLSPVAGPGAPGSRTPT
jgi:pimeloyl-ACP methyl ester carboxylesterase